MMELIIYLLKAVCVFALGFLPGCLALKAFTKQEGWELLLNSIAFSILFAAFSEFAAYLLSIDATLFNLSATILFLAACLIALRLKKPQFSPPPSLLIAFALAFLAIVSVQALIPFYSGAYWYGDWWLHYDISLFYLDHGPLDKTWFPDQYSVTARTPLFSLASGFFMSLLGREFWSFQVIASFLNTAFLIPLALLANRLGLGKKAAAALALALAIFSPAIMTSEVYTWPKLCAAFFILSALWYYLALRRQLQGAKMDPRTAALFGVHGAAAYMIHPIGILYVLPAAADFAILSLGLLLRSRQKFIRAGWLSLAVLLLAGLAIAAPWYAWAFHTYGVDETIKSSPSLRNMIVTKSPFEDRLQNAVATLYPLFQQQWYSIWFANSSPLELLKCKETGCYGAFYSVTLRFWLDTLPGALTLTGTLVLLAAIAGSLYSGSSRNFFRPSEPEFLFLLILPIAAVLGFLTTMYVDEKGWMSILFLPLILILQCFLARSLAGWHPALRVLAFAGIFAEFILVKGSHIYLLFTERLTEYETYNLPLKADNHLVFAFDYLGGGRILFALLALALFAILAAALYWKGVRAPYKRATASRPPSGRRPSRKARRIRRTARSPARSLSHQARPQHRKRRIS